MSSIHATPAHSLGYRHSGDSSQDVPGPQRPQAQSLLFLPESKAGWAPLPGRGREGAEGTDRVLGGPHHTQQCWGASPTQTAGCRHGAGADAESSLTPHALQGRDNTENRGDITLPRRPLCQRPALPGCPAGASEDITVRSASWCLPHTCCVQSFSPRRTQAW